MKDLPGEKLEVFANNIPLDTSIDLVFALADKLPIEYFEKVDPVKLANSVEKFDLDNMDESRKLFIANTIVSSNNPTALANLLKAKNGRAKS